MNGIIYKVTNKINNKIYIGQSINTLNRRRTNHYSSARNHNNNSIFHKALMKYSEDDFAWEIVEIISNNNIELLQKELNEKECYFIKLYESNNLNKGYNMTAGGESFQEQAQNFWDDPNRSDNWRKELSSRMTKYWSDESHIKHQSEQMNKFYKTKEGQEKAKQHSNFMNNYYNGVNARKNKAKTSHYFVKAISPNQEELIFISSKEPDLYFDKKINLRARLHQIGDIWIPTTRCPHLYGWKFEAIEKYEIV